MESYKSFIDNRTSEVIDEASLSRVWRQFTNEDNATLIISAFRGEYNITENLKRNRELASKIKSAGYGYVFVDGHWIEKGKISKDDGKEDSILVNGRDSIKLRQDGISWMKEYDQDAIIFKPSGGISVLLIDKEGIIKQFSDGIRIKDIERIKNELLYKKKGKDYDGSGYSQLRGHGNRSFVFEGIRIEKGWMAKL